MSEYKIGFRGKLIGLVLVALVGVSVFYSYQLYSFGTVSNNVLKKVVSDVDQVIKINNISVLFKSEVQAWKDILIRGADPASFEKYNHELDEFSAKIEIETRYIQANLTGKEAALSEEFLKNQRALTQNYKEAQIRFLKAGSFDMASADKSVKGKDRPVLNSLNELSTILTEKMKQSSSATIQSGLRTSLLWALLIGCCILVLSWFVVNRVVMTVLEIVEQLRQSSEQVGAASQQLSSASQQVSAGATEAASSLEETVASIEEVSSMVRVNSDNATKAADFSQESATLAENGKIEMERLIESMKGITSSSKKIEEIINVIDDIAFQTNILALNAAVEAARAGEQGKGFAVVADAVRSLAQKSASAAKDITVLIKKSVEQIESGGNNADVSGNVLKQIVTSIKQASALNKEIATGSIEQTNGISEINKAMNQLDSATQQNASISEEVASSSEELSTQALSLQNLVEDLTLAVCGSNVNSKQKVLSIRSTQSIHKYDNGKLFNAPIIADCVSSPMGAREKLSRRPNQKITQKAS